MPAYWEQLQRLDSSGRPRTIDPAEIAISIGAQLLENRDALAATLATDHGPLTTNH